MIRCFVPQLHSLLNRPVFLIGHIIEARYIHSRYLGQGLESFPAGRAVILGLTTDRQNLIHHEFTLTDFKEVNELMQRLRIGSTRSSGHDQRVMFTPLG
ncbi:hypothetical protein SDC9_183242 [bioreactor metagenome]|uniref:Uncharacterized protein n=1 Tax=bioreactor metagenome TaxID=1076179 RepID=A0A645HJC0_9ZZZZ